MESVRSRSSTSCLKVGLWDGTACQQSLIIIYLQEERQKIIRRSLTPSWHKLNHGSYSSWVHVEGRSMRWPSFSSLKSSSTGTPGYGEPPRVKISHSNTPKDHLTHKHTVTMSTINRQRHCVSAFERICSDVHVALMGVNAVEQSFRRHPFHR